jgi:toxin ParE1/3/4
MNLKITIQASLDLEEILVYTNETWGLEKASAYVSKLFQCFNKLLENNYLGISAEYINVNVRKFKVEKHVIFYSIESEDVVILRVLNTNIDINRVEIL